MDLNETAEVLSASLNHYDADVFSLEWRTGLGFNLHMFCISLCVCVFLHMLRNQVIFEGHESFLPRNCRWREIV